jgi:1,2-dihydroxy-3-keto-5-methylthiopentene dioxygenase
MKAYWLYDGEAATLDADALSAQGVACRTLSLDEADYQPVLDELRAERGYIEQDIVALSPDVPGLDSICAKFLDEHHHEEDEVRFVLEGDGLFDIRSDDDRWMRVLVEPGDLIVVPADRRHRFLLTERRAIRCVRLFQDKSGWVPRYRVASGDAASS